MSLRARIKALARLPRRLSVQLSLLLSLLIAATLIAHAWRTADRQSHHLEGSARKEAVILVDSVAASSAALRRRRAAADARFWRTASKPATIPHMDAPRCNPMMEII